MPERTMEVGERVRFEIPTIDFPEYTETMTIVKRGKWEVRTSGYTDIIPGEVVSGEGIIDERGRVVAEPEIQVRVADRTSLVDRMLIGISYIRKWAVTRLQAQLPEPMASLASGILLGVKARMPHDFYQALVNTGTLHVIAASGFNVMIVGNILIGLIGRVMRRGRAIAGGIVGIMLYVVLAGGSASIVRAGIMGVLTLVAFYFGRPTEARRLLWVTVVIMIMVDPTMVSDIGFQLSVAATAGLLYLEPVVEVWGARIMWFKRIQGVLQEYLWPTLAATVATAPIIAWHFGRVSLVGVGVNMVILPVIPLIMLLAALALIIPGVSYLLFPPLWWVVTVITYFG